jgi:GxxExxY protein
MSAPNLFEEPDPELDGLASSVISACIEVHNHLGPGYTEGIYERALCHELRLRRTEFERQVPLTVAYKNELVGEHRLDLLVGRRLIVELKAVEALGAVHAVQLRSYLKARGERLGLLINFNVPKLLGGVRRIIWTP